MVPCANGYSPNTNGTGLVHFVNGIGASGAVSSSAWLLCHPEYNEGTQRSTRDKSRRYHK